MSIKKKAEIQIKFSNLAIQMNNNSNQRVGKYKKKDHGF